MRHRSLHESILSEIHNNRANFNTYISTPKAGGMLPRTALSKGSVGHAIILQGNSFKFVLGYHEATTRHSYLIVGDKSKKMIKGAYLEAIFVVNTCCLVLSFDLTMAKLMKFKKGPKANATGLTHGSVSARSRPDDTAIALALSGEAMVDKSIIWSGSKEDCRVDGLVTCPLQDEIPPTTDGCTNALTPALHKVTDAKMRHIADGFGLRIFMISIGAPV